jgi:hypothetical protein
MPSYDREERRLFHDDLSVQWCIHYVTRQGRIICMYKQLLRESEKVIDTTIVRLSSRDKLYPLPRFSLVRHSILSKFDFSIVAYLLHDIGC